MQRVPSRIVPVEALESLTVAPSSYAAAVSSQPVAQVIPAPTSPPVEDMARAVIASETVDIGRGGVAQPATVAEPTIVKRRGAAGDKAFVASDPNQDEAFVF